MIELSSDKVLLSGVKLKDYLNDAIKETSDDYINLAHSNVDKIDALEYIRKYRNILLCMNEICKDRNKY